MSEKLKHASPERQQRVAAFVNRLTHKMRFNLMMDGGYLFPVNQALRNQRKRAYRLRTIRQFKRGHSIRALWEYERVCDRDQWVRDYEARQWMWRHQ